MQTRLIMDKVTGVFRRSGASVVSDMLASFHETHPSFPVRDAFIAACSISTDGRGQHPAYADVCASRALLVLSVPDVEAADLINRASTGRISASDALESCGNLSVRGIDERCDFAGELLKLAPLNRPLEKTFLDNFGLMCSAMGLSSDDQARVLLLHADFRAERERLLNSSAGLVTALVVILVFILAATYLKVVFFGFLLAYLFLPLEKFYERQIFASPVYRVCASFFKFIFSPLYQLKRVLTARVGFGEPREKTPEELERAQRGALASKASALTLVSVIVMALALVTLIIAVVVPFASNAGSSLSKWARENDFYRKADKFLETVVTKVPAPGAVKSGAEFSAGSALSPENVEPRQTLLESASEPFGSTGSEMAAPESSAVENVSSVSRQPTLREWLRSAFHELISSGKGAQLASYAFGGGGKGILSGVVGVLSFIGMVAFDLLFTVFFFFFFLQQMAVLAAKGEAKKRELSRDGQNGKNVGEWVVGAIFESGWFPLTLSETRRSAAIIINRIGAMFDAWLRGYLLIMATEFVLYSVIFFMFSVPYAPVIALFSCCTILLPYIGLACAATLGTAITVAFAGPDLAIALTGLAAGYLVVNGILEQLVLYPSLVGEAIGLTTIETIIVVLFGAVAAGVTGMILAVPAAALLKYLIPLIYRAWDRKKKTS